jgi:transcription elongation GreA/GreB family factor
LPEATVFKIVNISFAPFKPMTMTTDTALDLDIKEKLWEECLRQQTDFVDNARKAMEEAQTSANESQGAMEDKFESFREACQIQRDMFAKQLDEAISKLSVLKRIVRTKINEDVSLGSIVKTDAQNYFISISLGEIAVDGEKYFAISAASPVFQVMAGKTKGDTFTFRDKQIKVLDVF